MRKINLLNQTEGETAAELSEMLPVDANEVVHNHNNNVVILFFSLDLTFPTAYC